MEGKYIKDSQEDRTWGAVPPLEGQEEQEGSGKKTEKKSQEVSGQCLSQKKVFLEGEGSPQCQHFQ